MGKRKATYALIILNLLVNGSVLGNVDSLLIASYDALSIGDLENSKAWALEAYDLAQNQNQDSAFSAASYLLANGFQETANYSLARTYYERSIQIADIQGYDLLKAKALTSYGAMQAKIEEYKLAKSNIDLALSIARDLGDTSLIMHCFEHLGNLAFEQERFSEAKSYNEKCLLLAKDAKNYSLMAGTYQNISSALFSLRDYDEAESALRNCIALCEEQSDYTNLATAYQDLFYLLGETKQFEKLQWELRVYMGLLNERNVEADIDVLQRMAEVQADLMNEQNRSRKIMYALWGIVLILLLLSLVLNIRLLRGQGKALDTPQNIDLHEYLQPLLVQKDKLHVATYLFALLGLSHKRIGELLNRDRSTISHWMDDIETILGIENIKDEVNQRRFTAREIASMLKEMGVS